MYSLIIDARIITVLERYSYQWLAACEAIAVIANVPLTIVRSSVPNFCYIIALTDLFEKNQRIYVFLARHETADFDNVFRKRARATLTPPQACVGSLGDKCVFDLFRALRPSKRIGHFIFRPKSQIWSVFLKNTRSLKGPAQDLGESVSVWCWARILSTLAAPF